MYGLWLSRHLSSFGKNEAGVLYATISFITQFVRRTDKSYIFHTGVNSFKGVKNMPYLARVYISYNVFFQSCQYTWPRATLSREVCVHARVDLSTQTCRKSDSVDLAMPVLFPNPDLCSVPQSVL